MSADAVPSTSINLHGTAVAIGDCAALLRGPSGAGKSDLALRILGLSPGLLVAHAPRLVADDRVIATAGADGVTVSCPPALRGLIEVRGVGIVHVPSVECARLELVVDLAPTGTLERLPEPTSAEICGIAVRRAQLAPFEISAAIKLVLALTGAANDGAVLR